MISPDQVLKAYESAWRETNPVRRRAFLEIAWTDDGSYADPTGSAEGRPALASHIARHHANRPDHLIEISGDPIHVTGGAEFDWIMADGSGGVAMTGHDSAAFAPDGRIARLARVFDTQR